MEMEWTKKYPKLKGKCWKGRKNAVNNVAAAECAKEVEE